MKKYNKTKKTQINQKSKQKTAIAELKKYYPTLSDDLVIEGNLNLANRMITILPDNLTINGSLDLRDAYFLETLPENLTVKGNLYMDEDYDQKFSTGLTVNGQLSVVDGEELPEGQIVGGDLVLSEYTQFLPKNLTIGGSLSLKGTKIEELPEGLKVLGNLSLYELPIISLPKDLYVGGSLNCSHTKLKAIPESVYIGGGLSIDATNIKVFPKQIRGTVNGDLDIVGTRIKYLPDDLHIKGRLDAENSGLVELPKNLRVDGFLHIQKTAIEQLPEGLYIGGAIDMSGSSIDQLPAGLKIDGHLDLSDTLIAELPEDLVVNWSLYVNDSLIKRLPQFVNAGRLSLYPGQVKPDILPDGFTLTGELSVYCRDNEIKPFTLPDNMKIGGDVTITGYAEKSLPKNLHVGGKLILSENVQVETLPTDLTVKECVILTKYFTNSYKIMLAIITGQLNLPYSVVVQKDDFTGAVQRAFSVLPDIHDRVRPYGDEGDKIEILASPTPGVGNVNYFDLITGKTRKAKVGSKEKVIV